MSGDAAAPICSIATTEERDAVIALWEACGLTRPWNDAAADFDLALAGPASTILLLRADETLLGAIMVGHDGHRGAVYYFAVHPDHQRQGHGRRLMGEAEHWLRERSVPKINLVVRRSNAAILGFYEALGYGDNDCVSLGKRLDAAD